jgi:hypothetical protein
MLPTKPTALTTVRPCRGHFIELDYSMATALLEVHTKSDESIHIEKSAAASRQVCKISFGNRKVMPSVSSMTECLNRLLMGRIRVSRVI